MDEAAAAGIAEDGAENEPHSGHGASESSVGPTAGEPVNDRVGVFCCQDCGEAFREEAAYLEHRHQHLQENVYLDDQLDDLHDAGKDSEAAHFCALCSRSFAELSEFHLHMETNHSQTSQKVSGVQMNPRITKQHTYECLDCGKCYGVIGHLLNHQRSHRQASKSVFHDLEHLKKKSFQCESCGRNYSRASALDAHRRCHEQKLIKSRSRSSGDSCHTEESLAEAKPPENQADVASEKLFKCSCGKAFSALLRLKTHQRFSRNSQCSPEEMKEKPKKNGSEFYCSECNKAFSGHIALFNHQRWHANHSDDSAKRFPCEECGKVFMTLTFYYRHQRTAHSDETPAKSFLHQVCQLQKKAFECKDCGLKFSRASALHSHQLHHSDVFKETEKEAQMRTSLLPQQKSLESETKETERLEERVESEGLPPTSVAEEDSQVNEADEDVESYEPGDFNVQVISASESEDEAVQDLNPDLELLCESDQEARDDGDAEVSPGSHVSKPEMDLKIVQIDFEQADEQAALVARETESKAAGERFDCPECYRWFPSASSLRVHRMWHGVHKRRQQTQGQSVAVYACDRCDHEASSYAAHCSHVEKHKDQNANGGASRRAEGSERKNLTCSECGKSFSRLSALVSHQLHHPKRKQFQCPDCMTSYLHAASLFNHMKNCSAQKKENISVAKKEYNPKKTLLGPKIYHCEQCGKGFWSLGAYSHHKQSQTECADLRLRKGVAGSANGHSRSSVKVACPVCGRKFRHRGIMALHMRKHENGNHKCELCNRSFRLFSSLLRHQVVHSDQLLPPPVKSFQHQVEQLKKNTYGCPDCGKLFSRAKALQFHMKSHGYETGHSPSSPRSSVALEDRQCATCLAHFNNKASLRAHQKLCMKRDSRCKTEPSENNGPLHLQGDSTQESSGHLTLNTEVKNEMDSGELKAEDQTGSTDLKYKCNKCDRSFSVVGALNFHKRIHSEGRKSVGKGKLSMSAMLKKPKREEPSKGPFHCSECGRLFMSNSALGSHRRWHKDKKFSRSSLKDDDLKPVGLKAEDGPFQCNACGKQFFNRRVLQRHQMFNPQCQTKAEPEPDPSRSAGSNGALGNSENKTSVEGSLLAAHYENEHRKNSEAADPQADELVPADRVPEQVGVGPNGSEPTSSTPKPKGHQCPQCCMIFAKARGLRAHKWQAHSNSPKSKNKVPLSAKTEPTATSSDVRNTEDSPAGENATAVSTRPAAKKKSPAGRGRRKTTSSPQPVKLISCLDCGKQFSSAGALLDHKKVCLDAQQEPKVEVLAPKATAEVSPPLGRLPEHSAKCLFKCDKCGKAFQTEEQLNTHKAKAKSRPYCCALCCHGFWTENQLQQHLAWHDEVRCRLPNEVRYRLSAAMTPKPLKPSLPPADDRGKPSPSSTLNRPTPGADSQSQSSHKCQHCGKAFLSPTALQKHETQHCNNDSYHCSICPRTFSEIQDLIDHHQECISDYNRQSDAPAAVSPGANRCNIVCKDCGLTFTHREVFKTHLHQHALEAEEEEAQTGDASAPAADMLPESGDEDKTGDEDTGGGSSSSQPNPSEPSAGGDFKSKFRGVYGCMVCGKVYTYLVSFRKHQELHKSQSCAEKKPTVPDLHEYKCPDCGMLFIRRTRLLSHMRVHRSHRPLKTKPPRCDQCNKDFSSLKSWMSHVEIHKMKPFWCLSCARGFRNEVKLDKHLQGHSLRQHKCDICNKSFQISAQLTNHYNTHTGAKPYRCSFCGKCFSHSGNVIIHQKKHLRLYVMSKGIKKSVFISRKRRRKVRPVLTSVQEEPEVNENTEEPLGKEESADGGETQKLSADSESEGQGNSEESDCGEPMHYLAGTTGAEPRDDESRSETAEPQAGQELDESESQETNMHREHKYWEWECFECDMGFDDVAELHLHYIKHATGELPFPQDDIEG